jgi:hypothetical protein
MTLPSDLAVDPSDRVSSNDAQSELTIAPADTSKMMLLQLAYHSVPVVGFVLTNDFHTPNAVPRSASSPTRIGIEAMKVMALLLRAKELSKMGASGCTVVKPINAKTTMYTAAVIETVRM